jgi:hypothetical protein
MSSPGVRAAAEKVCREIYNDPTRPAATAARSRMALLGVLAASASTSCGMLATPSLRAPTRRLPAGACNTVRMGSLFAEPTAEDAASERRFAERDSRLKLVAERYNLDPNTDGLQIAARAASSLPEEENGTWADVAFGIARNACLLGLILTGLGALPSPSSAADCGELGPQAAALCNQARAATSRLRPCASTLQPSAP